MEHIILLIKDFSLTNRWNNLHFDIQNNDTYITYSNALYYDPLLIKYISNELRIKQNIKLKHTIHWKTLTFKISTNKPTHQHSISFNIPTLFTLATSGSNRLIIPYTKVFNSWFHSKKINFSFSSSIDQTNCVYRNNQWLLSVLILNEISKDEIEIYNTSIYLNNYSNTNLFFNSLIAKNYPISAVFKNSTIIDWITSVFNEIYNDISFPYGSPDNRVVLFNVIHANILFLNFDKSNTLYMYINTLNKRCIELIMTWINEIGKISPTHIEIVIVVNEYNDNLKPWLVSNATNLQCVIINDQSNWYRLYRTKNTLLVEFNPNSSNNRLLEIVHWFQRKKLIITYVNANVITHIVITQLSEITVYYRQIPKDFNKMNDVFLYDDCLDMYSIYAQCSKTCALFYSLVHVNKPMNIYRVINSWCSVLNITKSKLHYPNGEVMFGNWDDFNKWVNFGFVMNDNIYLTFNPKDNGYKTLRDNIDKDYLEFPFKNVFLNVCKGKERKCKEIEVKKKYDLRDLWRWPVE